MRGVHANVVKRLGRVQLRASAAKCCKTLAISSGKVLIQEELVVSEVEFPRVRRPTHSAAAGVTCLFVEMIPSTLAALTPSRIRSLRSYPCAAIRRVVDRVT